VVVARINSGGGGGTGAMTQSYPAVRTPCAGYGQGVLERSTSVATRPASPCRSQMDSGSGGNQMDSGGQWQWW
jgi:hypothetical protein